jgi:hypothetical protein
MALNLSVEEHPNIFKYALRHFPKGMLILAMCIAFICSPWLYHFFCQYEAIPPSLQIILTVSIVAIVPFLILYGITIFRVPGIRRDMQTIARITFEESSWDRADFLADHPKENGEGATFVKIEEKLVIEIYKNS